MGVRVHNGVMKLRIALTMGDPAGVGPELCVKVCSHPEVAALCDVVVVGNARVLSAAAVLAGVPVPSRILESAVVREDFPRGRVDAECGRAAYDALMSAIGMCQSGEADAVVTAPLNKAALHAAGVPEPGHTEILARATGSPRHALMLYSEKLACVFVTCHQSLASVPGNLSVSRVTEVVELAHAALKKLRGCAPRLALLALNPHAGEEGLFGDEERLHLIPAVRIARARGFNLSDPLPPDTAFVPEALTRYDAHVCMYHDQGAIPFKALAFDEGVNVTLGLPIVRTSVDHGTAFDIAWKPGSPARADSLLAAIRLAVRLSASPSASLSQ